MLAITSEKSPISYMAPFAIYMVCTSIDPEPSSELFPYYYCVKILFTTITLAISFPAWKRFLKLPSWYCLLAGILGAAVWIGLCQMDKRSIPDFLPGMGLEKVLPTTRPGYDWGVQKNEEASNSTEDSSSASNSTEDSTPTSNSGFQIQNCSKLFLVRMFGLVVIVPIMEELFLRGFLLRFFWIAPKKGEKSSTEKIPWYELPIGSICPLVWVITIIYPILTHPEMLAGVVWFSGITLLAWKTKSLSDCICAHAITNLALGIWVMYSGQWYLM